mmetsp:Transcript_20977/g.35184  ORF Transcript_20977/g.35184 Transcript_20977/m.35184 type:complete len:220 (+) Transcript_20977:380-1039(+)
MRGHSRLAEDRKRPPPHTLHDRMHRLREQLLKCELHRGVAHTRWRDLEEPEIQPSDVATDQREEIKSDVMVLPAAKDAEQRGAQHVHAEEVFGAQFKGADGNELIFGGELLHRDQQAGDHPVESTELGVKVKVIARDDVERVHEHEGCKAGDRVHDRDEFDELAGAPDRLDCTTEEHEGRGIEAYTDEAHLEVSSRDKIPHPRQRPVRNQRQRQRGRGE